MNQMYNVSFTEKEINYLIDICDFEICRRKKAIEQNPYDPVSVELSEKAINLYNDIKVKLIAERDAHLCLK